MNGMFANNAAFNQNISSWNTAAVNNMRRMFEAAEFNQNIGSWNTSSVTLMGEIFSGATFFNQNVGAWNIANAFDIANMFRSSDINQINYDAILIAWDIAGYLNKNLGDVAPLEYCARAAARSNLFNLKEWNFSGDNSNCLSAEIKIQANSISIPDGDTTPTLSDDTDFGTTGVLLGFESRTFTIENTSSAVLNITGLPILSGPNATDFLITGFPSIAIAANGGISTFQISFNPSGHGLRKATISIANNDTDENLYSFDIQGFGCGSLNINTNISSGTVTHNAVDITATNYICNANVTYTANNFTLHYCQALKQKVRCFQHGLGLSVIDKGQIKIDD